MTRQDFIDNVEGTQKQLRRFLTALCCGDTAAADDIAQDTYLKAYLGCDAFRDIKKFNSWIYKIAYNTFLNSKRRPLTEQISGHADSKIGVSQFETDSSFKYEELYLALDRLAPNERICLLLYYMEGYDVKEISSITEISPVNIRQHLSRGRMHLRQLLTNL